MGTGIAIGFVLCLIVQGLFLLGRRSWRNALPPAVPQLPLTPAQQANRAVYEAQAQHHPRLVSVRIARRTKRGRALLNVEREDDYFDD
jgi:hypothetical protein